MRRRFVSAALLFAFAAPIWADVAPIPSWRIVTNGTISGASQSGDAIYFGGNFTKIGRGIASFDGFLDAVSLSLADDPGCARRGDTFNAGGPRTSSASP
jgi:hypothetical protein